MYRLLCLAASLLLAPVAFADPAVVARLGELLSGMQQFEAQFNQRLGDQNGELLQESSGRVLVKHPGRFLWETEKPFPQSVVSDGNTVWQYDPDLKQVVRRPLDRRADQIPSLLLSGEIAAVQRDFEISRDVSTPGIESFQLLPRKNDSMFVRLAIRFHDGSLEGLEIEDGMGQRTDVHFDAVNLHIVIDDSRFSFVTPAGVDEIRDE